MKRTSGRKLRRSSISKNAPQSAEGEQIIAILAQSKAPRSLAHTGGMSDKSKFLVMDLVPEEDW